MTKRTRFCKPCSITIPLLYMLYISCLCSTSAFGVQNDTRKVVGALHSKNIICNTHSSNKCRGGRIKESSSVLKLKVKNDECSEASLASMEGLGVVINNPHLMGPRHQQLANTRQNRNKLHSHTNVAASAATIKDRRRSSVAKRLMNIIDVPYDMIVKKRGIKTSHFPQANILTKPERAHRTQDVTLVDISWLKAHEQVVSEERVRNLRQCIREWNAYRLPLLVDRKSGAILDGHHRYAAGRQMGLSRLPAILVDYLQDDTITVDVWPDCGIDCITKEEVLQMSLSDRVFPPKTSRHDFVSSLAPISVPLEKLRS
jgi:hypothetical protein